MDRHYVAALGFDPDDPDWAAIGRDWVESGDLTARGGLYGKLVARRLVPATVG